ncbi:MAG: hypothetical protein AB1898_05990 [Acidobacteriota bacterium]
MSRDWKKIAEGLALGIPEGEIEKLLGPLEALRGQLASLISDLPHETEPAGPAPISEEDM